MSIAADITEAILNAHVDPRERPFFAKVQDHFRQVTSGRRSEPVDRYLEQLIEGGPLSDADARLLFEEILRGDLAQDQIGSLLIALQADRVSASALAVFARVLRDSGLQVVADSDSLGDTCGTGSDTMSTFNVSTTIMFVLAAAGIPIAKHGNVAVTSQCGSADVLQELGVRIDLDPHGVEECIRQTGLGFMFAPVFHRAMRNLKEIRRVLAHEMPDSVKGRTVFNVLGPLANPAGAKRQIIGVYSPTLLDKFAEALRLLGLSRAFVAYGTFDGMDVGFDEFSTAGTTLVAELSNGTITHWEVTPEEAGLERVTDPAAYSGGDKKVNARILLNILSGREEGARMNLALMNAGAGLLLAEKVGTIGDGVELARKLIRDGAALAKFHAFRDCSRNVA